MPIILNTDNSSVSVVDVNGNVSDLTKNSAGTTSYSPKFFNTKLTGKGGSSKGLLNESIDPKMMKSGYNVIDTNMRCNKISSTNKTIYNIPCSMITNDMWRYIEFLDRPEDYAITKIANNGTEDIYLYVPIYAIQLEEDNVIQPDGKTKNTYSLYAAMNMFLFDVKDTSTRQHKFTPNMDMFKRATAKSNLFYRCIVSDLRTSLRDIISKLTAMGYDVDKPAMSDFFDNYSIYSELCKASERWQTQAEHVIADILIPNINTFTNNSNNAIWTSPFNSVSDILARLEKYSVPLDQYQKMYDKMAKTVNPDILADICKSNLNLRLSNTLNHMNQNKALLEYCPCNVHVQSTIPFSKEQRDAIESTSPLTLVQSGAGTGKSTVILGRIDHMIKNGIDPKDITVLSFTNAAADHIRDLKPSINSMTIASMLNAIYENNFPDHQLSSISTIINSLDIYFDPNYASPAAASIRQDFIWDFKTILKRLRDDNEYTQATNYIESNIDNVIKTLDIIKQTSLELESIICYTKMDSLIEPPETQTKHLIIDEVQDNSIAEFIYSIKYVDKHHSSLYIVGDCSQTLYEFRSSNPKALNVLESSNVFDIHKLQTNYRSNQEILDFANVLLDNIEANQYANIQLHANSLKPVTLQSFQTAVNLHYERLQNTNDVTIENMLLKSIASDMKDYINDKIAKKEQICFLAFKSRTINYIYKVLQGLYPDAKIVSLVPKRPYDSTIFSQFIARLWGQVTFVPPSSILDSIETILLNNVSALVSRRMAIQVANNMCAQLMAEFKSIHSATIKEWEKQVQQNMMSIPQLLEETKRLMIEFEIKKNAIAKSLLSRKNEAAKTANNIDDANFILSTIHSAKGLEFDNVVVYYKNESETTMEEATKRMYYVAFTRAKKTEFIYAYDKMARPKIEADYERIIKSLTAQAKANGTLPANTQPITVMPSSLTPMPLPPSATGFVSDAHLRSIPIDEEKETTETVTDGSDPVETTNTPALSIFTDKSEIRIKKTILKSNNPIFLSKLAKSNPKAKKMMKHMHLKKHPSHKHKTDDDITSAS